MISYVLIKILSNKKENFSSWQPVAVLPFKNAGADKSQDYLAEGITNEIINNLARIESLNVISMSSVERYKNSNTDYAKVADELNVSHILTGDFQKSGDKMSINIRLIDVKRNNMIWQKNYNINYHDVFIMENLDHL